MPIPTNRRDFLKTTAVATAGLWSLLCESISFANADAGWSPASFELPPLPYTYDALEPAIDARTMKIHHDLHHAAYVKGLNAALSNLNAARASGDMSAIQALSRQLAFHGGGHYNHTVFWANMAPTGTRTEPSERLSERLKADFGSVDAFKAHFSAAAKAVEGSGWAVLGWNASLDELVVLTMLNQQDLTILGTEPLLMLDVWEHAYYLKYQNRRAEYVDAWWSVVNWRNVSERFEVVSLTGRLDLINGRPR
jgi:Fe-Mn family superoxide dismutase